MATKTENRQKSGTLIAIVVVFILACMLAGLIAMMKFVGSSGGGTLRSGRSVMTYTDSLTMTSAFKKDTATITTAGKTIVIEPTRLLIDGSVVAEIDEAVEDVAVHVESGEVRFVADGNNVVLSDGAISGG